MQIKTLTGIVLIASAASLAACTTRPVTVDTPGPGALSVPVPVPANANMILTDRVKAALNTGLGTNAAGIEVRAENGTVYLTGRVATQALHEQAIAIARGTADVQAVVHTGLVVD